jgi:hypothetical protein
MATKYHIMHIYCSNIVEKPLNATHKSTELENEKLGRTVWFRVRDRWHSRCAFWFSSNSACGQGLAAVPVV